MDSNQLLLGVILVGIVIIAGITVYNQLVPSQSITQIGESTTSINAEVAKLITSMTALSISTSKMNTSITQFIQDSRDYYKSNSNAISNINDLVESLQSAVFNKNDLMALLTIVNDKLKSMKSGKFVGSSRGYFSINDTADQIADTVNSIQSNLATNTEQYLIKSAMLSDYLSKLVEGDARIGKMNTNITNIQSDLNKTITNLDAYLKQIGGATLTFPTNIATFCYQYADNPTRTLFYKPNDGSCNPKWGWGATHPNVGLGANLVGFTSPQPNTAKYCFKHNTTGGSIFYKPVDGNCKSFATDWTYSDANVSPGELYLYPTAQPNTQKLCYRYANNPVRTLFYRPPDGSNCASQWGWDYSFTGAGGVGNGGEVWAPII